MAEQLIISADLDGALWHHQRFMRELFLSMQARGHEVGILTSHKLLHEHADRALLRERGFPEPSFYIGRPMSVRGATLEELAQLKAQAIREHGIDLHFDDGHGSDVFCARLRELLGKQAYRLVVVTPRGGEEEHFE